MGMGSYLPAGILGASTDIQPEPSLPPRGSIPSRSTGRSTIGVPGPRGLGVLDLETFAHEVAPVEVVDGVFRVPETVELDKGEARHKADVGDGTELHVV